MSRILVLGIVASLVPGAALVAVSEPEPPHGLGSITVPVARVGETVVCDSFNRTLPNAAWDFLAPLGLAVSGLASALDENFIARPSVVISTLPSRDEVVAARMFVDLSTREIVNIENRDPRAPSHTRVRTDFGPHLGENPRWGHPDVSWLGHQGTSLAVGDDLTNATQAAFRNAWGLSNDRVEDFAYAHRVVGGGIVNGSYAVEVRVEASLRYQSSMEWALLGGCFPSTCPPRRHSESSRASG